MKKTRQLYFKKYTRSNKRDENEKIVVWRRVQRKEGYVRPEDWRKKQSEAHKARWEENRRIREEYGVDIKEAWEIMAQLEEQATDYMPRQNEKMRQLWAENKVIREENCCSIQEAWEILRIKRGTQGPS